MKRIAFSNEDSSIDGHDLKIDGDVMKKVVSGGDPITCREHYKGEVELYNNCSLFVFLNSMRDSSPADAMLTCVPFKMPYKFVSNPSDICEKQGNNDIKQEIKTNRNVDIITKILFDAYGDVITENDFTPSMAEEYKEVCLDKGTEAPSILRNRFVNNCNGWVSFSELKCIFKPAQLSDTKLGVFLKERGMFHQKK